PPTTGRTPCAAAATTPATSAAAWSRATWTWPWCSWPLAALVLLPLPPAGRRPPHHRRPLALDRPAPAPDAHRVAGVPGTDGAGSSRPGGRHAPAALAGAAGRPGGAAAGPRPQGRRLAGAAAGPGPLPLRPAPTPAQGAVPQPQPAARRGPHGAGAAA